MDVAALTRALAEAMPLKPEPLERLGKDVGLVIVDEVNGFCTVGAGPLAPPVPNAQVSTMVSETVRLARAFLKQGLPVLAFLDTHVPGKAEPPYPPHCEAGTGQEELVPELKWLEAEPGVTLVRKDCINGFIGASAPGGGNAVVDWIAARGLKQVLVVGICTDICVMDFVLTLLSARNHGMAPPLEDVLVYDRGCATYDLPRATAEQLGYGAVAAHPQAPTHHMGLYFMASRGARLISEVAA